MSDTRRCISLGAEDWLYRPISVLDHGYVELINYLGNDHTPTEAARVSTKGLIQDCSLGGHLDRDKKLTHYLLKNRHTSPFEQVVFTFRMKLPIFVARQLIRHRTARVNEMSARYSRLPGEVYVPKLERLMKQGKENKQGSEGELNSLDRRRFLDRNESATKSALSSYYQYLEDGVARELARICLPVSIYTEWVWQMDLHNLFHFLKLRMDKHAQWEIQQYAQAIANIVKDSVPMCWEAFEKYQLTTVTLTQEEHLELLEKAK